MAGGFIEEIACCFGAGGVSCSADAGGVGFSVGLVVDSEDSESEGMRVEELLEGAETGMEGADTGMEGLPLRFDFISEILRNRISDCRASGLLAVAVVVEEVVVIG